MSRTLRRFEVLLPLRFNDGQPVPNDLVADTLIELEERAGGRAARSNPGLCATPATLTRGETCMDDMKQRLRDRS